MYKLLSLKSLNIFFSIICLFVGSILFGYVFKIEQLEYFNPSIINNYPSFFFAPIPIVSFFIFSFFGLLFLIRYKAFTDSNNLLQKCSIISLVFFVAVFLGAITQARITILILLFSYLSFETYYFIKSKKYRNFLHPIYIFFFYFAILSLSLPVISPIMTNNIFLIGRWDDILDWYSHIVESGYYNDISLIGPSNFLGAAPHHFSIFTKGLFINILSMIFKVNPNDSFAIVSFFKYIVVIILTIGSFGTYSFFKYSLNLKSNISIIFGLLFILGNSSIIGTLGNEFPIHIVAICFLPLTLFFLHKGINGNNIIFFYISGFLIGFNFEIIPTHPKSFITMPLIILCFIVVYIISNIKDFKNRIKNTLIFVLGVIVSFINFFYPIFYSMYNNYFRFKDYSDNKGIDWTFSTDLIYNILLADIPFRKPLAYVNIADVQNYYYLGSFFFLMVLLTPFILWKRKELKMPFNHLKIYLISIPLSITLCLVLLGKSSFMNNLFELLGIYIHYVNRYSQYFMFVLLLMVSLNIHYLQHFLQNKISLKILSLPIILTFAFLVVSLLGVNYPSSVSITSKFMIHKQEVVFFFTTLITILILFYDNILRKNKIVHCFSSVLCLILICLPFVYANSNYTLEPYDDLRKNPSTIVNVNQTNLKVYTRNSLVNYKPLYHFNYSKIINLFPKNQISRAFMCFNGNNYNYMCLSGNNLKHPYECGLIQDYGVIFIRKSIRKPWSQLQRCKILPMNEINHNIKKFIDPDVFSYLGIQYLYLLNSTYKENKDILSQLGFDFYNTYEFKYFNDKIIILFNKSIKGIIEASDKSTRFRIIESKEQNNFRFFHIDCKSENCSFVYKDYYNDNWYGNSNGKTLAIGQNKDNFKTINLKRGRHFIFMEFRPLYIYITILLQIFISLFIIIYARKIEFKNIFLHPRG
ncbi:MAG: hypothetical protein H7A23_17850 [Leptospiraceae bacterium]|nr:hypothetical protein [Leptospiraceae bacterium]